MNSAQYQYVEIVNGNLICCICRTPFIDPVETRNCSHTFCKECITSALIVNPQCPVDRSPLSPEQLLPAATIVRNLVDELMVECPHITLGCDARCQRSHLVKHLASACQFVQVKCPEEGCSHDVLRKDLGKHFADCTHRLVDCEACSREVKLSEMDIHHGECPAIEITCVHCLETLSRSALKTHQAECPHTPISCTHQTHGCHWFGPRHTLNDVHISQCPYEAIKGFLMLHGAREKDLVRENTELKRKVEDLERASRSHQRDLDMAKVRLGTWFRPAIPSDSGSDGTNSATGSPSQRPTERRRLSVPFNSAIFDLDLPPAGRSTTPPSARRSTVSSAAPPILPGISSTTALPSADDSSTPHPVLSQSQFYARGSNNPVAPLNLGGSLEGTLSSLRASVVALSGSLDSLERKQDIMLTTETLRMHEDVASLRAIVHGLRMQVHNIMMDRNAYFSSRNLPPSSPVSNGPRPSTSTNASSLSAESSDGGTSYTISQFPHSHHLSTSARLDTGDQNDSIDAGVSSATRYVNHRPPPYFNLSPNIITTVRRGPEGKL